MDIYFLTKTLWQPFFYVMDAILDFILITMSKNISRNTTTPGLLIQNTLGTRILMYVSL